MTSKRYSGAKPGDELLEWCMYRLNLLMNGKQREGARAGYVGSEGSKVQMHRAQLAKWLLDELEQKK
jgi:hypothetical protein